MSNKEVTSQDVHSTQPSSSEEATGFPGIDEAMARARAKYAAHPELRPHTGLPAKTLTADDIDFNNRLDSAVALSETLLYEARIQLGAPRVAPRELTPAEEAEKAAAEAWSRGHAAADALTTKMLDENERLFQEVMASAEKCQAKGVPLPDNVRVPSPPQSPKIEWLKGVPMEVKNWTKDSKKPFREFREPKVALMPYDYPVTARQSYLMASAHPQQKGDEKRTAKGSGLLKRALSFMER